jgi:hypothetical protein
MRDLYQQVKDNRIVQSFITALVILISIAAAAYLIIMFLVYSCRSNSSLLLLTPLIIITVLVVTVMVYHYKKSKAENEITITDEILEAISNLKEEFTYAPRVPIEYLGPGISAYQFWLETRLAESHIEKTNLKNMINFLKQGVSVSEIKEFFPEDHGWSIEDQKELCITFNGLLSNKEAKYESMD